MVKHYDADQKYILQRITDVEQLIREHTVANVDVGLHDSYAIVIGKYRNHDYVRAFQIRHDDFPPLVDRLVEINKHYQMGRIDAHPSFHAIIDHLF